MINNDCLINKILELEAAKFQKICDDFFRENGYPNIVSYGLIIKGIKTKKGPLIHTRSTLMELILFLNTQQNKAMLVEN